MNQYIAFLKGINVGKRRVKMDALKCLFEEMEFAEVSTFIASGNVLFQSRAKDGAALELTIAGHLEAALGYEVDTFVRSARELADAVDFRPFPSSELAVPSNTLHVAFLHAPLCEELREKLLACRTAVDEFAVHGREFYWLCRIRTAESKVWSGSLFKRMPSATLRNMTTLRKIAAKCQGEEVSSHSSEM